MGNHAFRAMGNHAFRCKSGPTVFSSSFAPLVDELIHVAVHCKVVALRLWWNGNRGRLEGDS